MPYSKEKLENLPETMTKFPSNGLAKTTKESTASEIGLGRRSWRGSEMSTFSISKDNKDLVK